MKFISIIILLILIGCSDRDIVAPVQPTEICDAIITYGDGSADTLLNIFSWHIDGDRYVFIDTCDVWHSIREDGFISAVRSNCRVIDR